MKKNHTKMKKRPILEGVREGFKVASIAVACMLSSQISVNAQCSPDITAPSGLVSGMSYTYYEGSWNSLPDFNSLTPVSSGIASGINLNNTLSADNYGLTFDGYINVPSDGDYTFYTSSDDGSTLSIDGNQVVDNDGLHGSIERSGQICLDAGYHAISVEFFEKTGGEVLSASYSGPGVSKTAIPTFYSNGSVPSGNLALNGTATQSSTNHGGSAGRAIDGNTNGNWSGGSVTHTATAQNQWWQVDLGITTNVGEIKLFDRIDGCCDSRLMNFTVSVINSNGTTTFSQSFNTSPDPTLTVNANGALGQIVKVQLNENNTPLSLAEVEVYGTTTTGTDCAGVIGGSASIDGCGVCSGGTTGIAASSPQTWYQDLDGDGSGDASSSIQDCDQPSGYVSTAGDNCPNDANKTSPGDCGCGVVEGTCSGGCTKTTAFTEAECFDDVSGAEVEASGNTGGENLGHIGNGDWARYNNINLTDVNTFNAFLSGRNNGRSVEVRLDNLNGTLIGTLSVPNTGEWHDYVTVSTSISSVSGSHDVFLVFRGGSFNIGSFGFTEEAVVEPGACSDLTSNISLSHNNPGCSNNDGTITVTFANSSDQSQIQLSLNGGSSYPVTVNDNSGSYTFTGLSNGQFEVAARYSNNVCEFNIGTKVLIRDCGTVSVNPGGVGWHDSFEANGLCWCSTENFDHDLDEEEVTINGTRYNVVDICDELKSHPLIRSRNDNDKIYNDIQCGNGPLNSSVDEPLCPGRVDIGRDGCLETGAHWDMEWLANRSRFGGGSTRTGSIGEIENMVFVVPTIAVDKITIEGVSIGESFKIYSTEGILISDDIYFGEVNVEGLDSGVYILKTESESVRFTKQ